MLVNHTTVGMDGLPVGRFFRAEVEGRGDGRTWMVAHFFMVADEQGRRLANAIDGGIIAEATPTGTYERIYCSVCGAGELDCEHVPGRLYEGRKRYAVMTGVSDFWEGSLVWAGQQRGTGFHIGGLEPSRAGLYVAGGRDPREYVDTDAYLASLAQRRAWDAFWNQNREWAESGREIGATGGCGPTGACSARPQGAAAGMRDG